MKNVLEAANPGRRPRASGGGQVRNPRRLGGPRRRDRRIGSVDPDLAPSGQRVETGWKQVVHTIAAALANACGPEVDLLVTGSRRPWEHFLAGSVTKHLITEAPCPVLVVPHTREV